MLLSPRQQEFLCASNASFVRFLQPSLVGGTLKHGCNFLRALGYRSMQQQRQAPSGLGTRGLPTASPLRVSYELQLHHQAAFP